MNYDPALVNRLDQWWHRRFLDGYTESIASELVTSQKESLGESEMKIVGPMLEVDEVHKSAYHWWSRTLKGIGSKPQGIQDRVNGFISEGDQLAGGWPHTLALDVIDEKFTSVGAEKLCYDLLKYQQDIDPPCDNLDDVYELLKGVLPQVYRRVFNH